MQSKTKINWSFNDIRYLFIACLNSKIDVSQQAAVRVSYILKKLLHITTDFMNFYISGSCKLQIVPMFY